jgi:dethiobiotin synthetase
VAVLVVSGTGTDVGKTVVTAAVVAAARAAGRPVSVVKAAQTGLQPGEPGDLADVARLSGLPPADASEGARYPDPLSPEAAARLAGLPPVDLRLLADHVRALDAPDRLVLVEGAGGLLVRFDEAGATLADLAVALGAEVLLVTRPGLGALNEVALSLEALAHRRLACRGVVIGAWPAEPDLATRSNVEDLSRLPGAPLLGAVPAGAGAAPPERFRELALAALAPPLGGTFDAGHFRRTEGLPDAGGPAGPTTLREDTA